MALLDRKGLRLERKARGIAREVWDRQRTSSRESVSGGEVALYVGALPMRLSALTQVALLTKTREAPQNFQRE